MQGEVMEGQILIIKHVESEGPGLIEKVFAADGWEIRKAELGSGALLPESLDETAAVIVLGGPMNVYEEVSFPFLKEEDRLIRKAIVEEVPFLGICLGAQLLAKTCGAEVKKAPSKEMGWYTATLTPQGRKDALFEGCPARLNVFQWHEDTFDVPEGGVLLGTGRTCMNQAFRIGPSAYGLQFHMEATPAMIECWMKDEADRTAARKTLSDTARLQESAGRQAIRLFSNFKQLVESSLRIKKVMRIFVDDEKASKKGRSLLWWNKKEHSLVPFKL
jgi:GMP synthase (glutamine-hydrolysing)